MKALIKKPGKPFQRISIDGELKTLQKLVGGYIEVVPICKDTVCVCNEEGRLMGLEPNCAINGIDFVGTILIMGSKDGDFCDIEEVIDEDWKVKVVEYVSPREAIRRKKGGMEGVKNA